MGSWGIRAHDSDCGLDLLGVAVDKHLRIIKFKYFHIKHINELLKSHIIGSYGECFADEVHYIDFFYEYTFPYDYAHAVMLIAECLAEYSQKGTLVIYDYKPKRKIKRTITDVIYTREDLETLRNALQSMLNPNHSLYQSWKGSTSFNEWQLHIQTLCETLANELNKLNEGGGDCG